MSHTIYRGGSTSHTIYRGGKRGARGHRLTVGRRSHPPSWTHPSRLRFRAAAERETANPVPSASPTPDQTFAHDHTLTLPLVCTQGASMERVCGVLVWSDARNAARTCRP
eukprot:1885899-Prymnesium_polylepis.1